MTETPSVKRTSWKWNKKFAMLPRLMLAHRRLSAQALKLALVLADRDYGERDDPDKVFKGFVYPAKKGIMGRMGRTSRNTINKYERELVKAGFLEVQETVDEQGRQIQNVYTFTFPVFHSVEELIKDYHVKEFILNMDDLTISGMDGVKANTRVLCNDDAYKKLKLFFKCLGTDKKKYIDMGITEEAALQKMYKLLDTK